MSEQIKPTIPIETACQIWFQLNLDKSNHSESERQLYHALTYRLTVETTQVVSLEQGEPMTTYELHSAIDAMCEPAKPHPGDAFKKPWVYEQSWPRPLIGKPEYQIIAAPGMFTVDTLTRACYGESVISFCGEKPNIEALIKQTIK